MSDLSPYASRLARTLPELQDRVARAAERSGRSAVDVRIVAVSKGHPLAAVRAALEAGISDLGENRVGEFTDKAAGLGDGVTVRWHFIGHIQSRKTGPVAQAADLVHSVDRLKLARRLSRDAELAGRVLPVLVQVNTSGEDSKGGFVPAEAEDAWAGLLQLPGLDVRGLMTMAPFTPDEAVLRSTFRRLRELNERLGTSPAYGGTELSMGMSNDFEIAVEEGSTLIRVGTALFGERT